MLRARTVSPGWSGPVPVRAELHERFLVRLAFACSGVRAGVSSTASGSGRPLASSVLLIRPASSERSVSAVNHFS